MSEINAARSEGTRSYSDSQSVLVAGATGTLGQQLIVALQDQHEVSALIRPGSESKLTNSLADPQVVLVGEVTDPTSLNGVCNGIDTTISAVGITRQRDGFTYEDVDYQANLNLLREAERAGVHRFVFVSVVGADRPSDVPVIDAKHRFERALMESTISSVIIRPSGFFTDLLDILAMAQRGTVFQFGNGENRISPIDVVDLSRVVASCLTLDNTAIDVGGPENLTWNQIGTSCFSAVSRRPRIIHVPRWVLRALLAVLKPLSASRYGVLSFLGHVQTQDTTAPNHGTLRLDEFLANHLEEAAATATK
jgi:uncharacterized protein YbjT (DUF2867 family)